MYQFISFNFKIPLRTSKNILLKLTQQNFTKPMKYNSTKQSIIQTKEGFACREFLIEFLIGCILSPFTRY